MKSIYTVLIGHVNTTGQVSLVNGLIMNTKQKSSRLIKVHRRFGFQTKSMDYTLNKEQLRKK
jgi:hypothetical protein